MSRMFESRKKVQLSSSETPATSRFKPRSFGLKARNVEEPPQKQQAPDMQTKEEGAQHGGFNFGEISIFPPDKAAPAPSGIQTKLSIGRVGDKYEQEADRVASQVMSMPSPTNEQPVQREEMAKEDEEKMVNMKPLTNSSLVQREEIAPEEDEEKMVNMKPLTDSSLVQREEIAPEEDEEKMVNMKPLTDSSLVQREEIAPEEDEEKMVNMKPLTDSSLVQREEIAPEEDEEKMVNMKPSQQQADAGIGGNSNLESQLNVSKGGGSPLPDNVRSYMEPRFGFNFADVRVHTDSQAVQMNQQLGAQAFTHGSDIYYGAGKSADNSNLTAHELTHVVQQTGGKVQEALDNNVSIKTETGLQPKLAADVTSIVQCKFPDTKDGWNTQLASMTGNTAADWVSLLTTLDEDGNSFKVESNQVVINDTSKLAPAALEKIVQTNPNRIKEICDKSRLAKTTFKPPADYIKEFLAEFNLLQSGGAKIPAVTGANSGYHNETYSPNSVKTDDVVAQWKAFLGPGPYGNTHPRTGVVDPDRIISNDGKRSIRYGNHEKTSKPSNHHYHEETWTYDAGNNKMNVDNVVRRVPLKEK